MQKRACMSEKTVAMMLGLHMSTSHLACWHCGSAQPHLVLSLVRCQHIAGISLGDT